MKSFYSSSDCSRVFFYPHSQNLIEVILVLDWLRPMIGFVQVQFSLTRWSCSSAPTARIRKAKATTDLCILFSCFSTLHFDLKTEPAITTLTLITTLASALTIPLWSRSIHAPLWQQAGLLKKTFKSDLSFGLPQLSSCQNFWRFGSVVLRISIQQFCEI